MAQPLLLTRGISMKKLIAISMLCVVLLVSCGKKPASSTSQASQPTQQSSSAAQSGSSSKGSSSSSKPKDEIKIPSSVPPTKSGIEGEDVKYPEEKIDVKLQDLSNDFITKQNGVLFSYQPSMPLPENEGGGKRLYQIKFENGEMYWYYGKVESEYIYRYKGFYTLVQDGVIEATLVNENDSADEMQISLDITVPVKVNSSDVIMQVRMLSCSNNFFADMADLLLVYHS